MVKSVTVNYGKLYSLSVARLGFSPRYKTHGTEYNIFPVQQQPTYTRMCANTTNTLNTHTHYPPSYHVFRTVWRHTHTPFHNFFHHIFFSSRKIPNLTIQTISLQVFVPQKVRKQTKITPFQHLTRKSPFESWTFTIFKATWQIIVAQPKTLQNQSSKPKHYFYSFLLLYSLFQLLFSSFHTCRFPQKAIHLYVFDHFFNNSNN